MTQSVHTSIIDLIDNETSLETEQAEHDDVVSSITLRIQTLIASINPLQGRKKHFGSGQAITKTGGPGVLPRKIWGKKQLTSAFWF